MKRIIVYGVNSLELRRKVEHFLSDDYEIIGYMDTYLDNDILDNKRFISYEQLNSVEFDYIVVAVKSDDITEEIKHKLIKEGRIAENKIINPVIFKKTNYLQKDLVRYVEKNLSHDTEILIFGLSYSLRGIDKRLLKKKAFDFSWHGLDLYYNYKLLRFAMSEHLCGGVECSFLVFPYYYFNYDMSCSAYQYESGQIISVHRLKDYHNRKELKGIFLDYNMCEEMFAQKYLDWYGPAENIYAYKSIIGIAKEKLPQIWDKEYVQTLNENKIIYKKLLDELLVFSKNVVLVVPPFYIKGIDNISVISKMKKLFTEITKYRKDEIAIIDLFDNKKFQHEEFFSDATHLNYIGAKEMTKVINAFMK